MNCIDCGKPVPGRSDRAEPRGRVSPRCAACRKARRLERQRFRWHEKFADRRRERTGAEKRVFRRKPPPEPVPTPRPPECAACGAVTRLYAHDGERVCLPCWHRWRTA